MESLFIYNRFYGFEFSNGIFLIAIYSAIISYAFQTYLYSFANIYQNFNIFKLEV